MTGLNPVRANEQYSSEVLYTIPWGEGPGCLSTAFNSDEYGWVFSPCPWAVSNSGITVIAEGFTAGSRLVSFDSNGTPLGSLTLYESGVPFPSSLSISDNGIVCLGYGEQLFLLDSSLSIINASIVSLPDAHISPICLSDHNSFWVLISCSIIIDDESYHQRYLVECYDDGSLAEPILIYDGSTGEGTPGIVFVTPTGEFRTAREDMFGYTYRLIADDPDNGLTKYSPSEQEVYNHYLESDPGWTWFDITVNGTHYFVSWSGDFYTLHATDDGAVLTYYELNLPPVCLILVITLMPYQGPSPAAIEFDATHSADPNEGDTLTYEWDFDGDRIFGEPGDDDYTGDPDNPTHEYTSDYNGPVFLRVTDNHGAFSICSVQITVDIV